MTNKNNQLFIFSHHFINGSLFFLLIIIGYLIYSQGLTGGFIFDDMPNLSPLGKYTSLNLWDNFWLFILEGQSGPTGRPISLASFYLNDIKWPSQAYAFIKTNILIHLLNGALVFWLSLRLTKTANLSTQKQVGFSLLTSVFWLLHPMQTTTVLYVIQRMTELSATFMLTGMVFYLYGREKLATNIKKGFLILFLGVGISLLLAILSKENGILLVAYILVIEFFLLRPLDSAPPKYFYIWLVPTIVIPFLFIIIYLGVHTNPDNFSFRNFTLKERLLTEPRVFFDYLHHIFIPNMNAFTLFHDDYVISKSLFSPWTTLPSIIGVAVLFISAFILRLKYPLISFAIAWFFAGHLIESTVLPLELYFEHRNYLPIFGIAFSIAIYAKKWITKFKITTVIIVASILITNSFIVLQNAYLWGKPLELSISWYKNHPESVRSKETYLLAAKMFGVSPELINTQKMNKLPDNSMFYTSILMYKLADSCSRNKANKEMLESTLVELENNIIHPATSTNTMNFLSNWQEGKCNQLNANDIEQFLIKLSSLENMKHNNIFLHDIYYFLSSLYQKKNDLNKTIVSLDKAYLHYPNSEILKLRVAYLLSAGLYDEALKALDDTSQLKTTFRKKLAMKIKKKELDQLKQIIHTQMQQKQANNKSLR